MDDSLKKYLRRDQLKPLCEINSNDRNLLFNHASVRLLGPSSLVSEQSDTLTFLLEGEVSLFSGGFVVEKFNHNDERALSLLFNRALDEDSALTRSHGAVLDVDRELFEGLYSQQKASSIEVSEMMLGDDESTLFEHLLKAFQQNRLQLPAFPQAALKIRQVINSPDIVTKDIIQIVQTDPVLSARLVKVANSPLYGTWREIKTVGAAVRRLGLETTRNLSFSLSIKQLFNAKTALARQQIQRIYDESVGISALAYVFTRHRADHLDPEQSLLAGLVQNLGLIPILKFIDERPKLIKKPEMLEKSMSNLLLPISTLLFNQWNFDSDFIKVVEEAKNWTRDTGKPADYADLVIAARLLYLHRADQLDENLVLDQLPVIKKLDLLDIDDSGLFFFEQAQQEIDDTQRLLRV